MSIKSPITQSVNTKHIINYLPSIMSDSRIIDKKIDNYICLDTGLIFNATGPRGSEKNFYTDVYDLHSESNDSEFKYFEENESVGIYEDITTFISQNVSYNTKPAILDIGCGKGMLLSRLGDFYLNSSLFGVEPSKNAHKFFQKSLPHIEIYEGVFEESHFIKEKFNLITANGVLEHVPYPVEFMKQIRASIYDDGFVYIGVPNFKNNPADLFTYDHLSRLTPETADLIFQLAGFEIIASRISTQRVPMWFILKPCIPKQLSHLSVDISIANKLIEKTIGEIEAFFNSYETAVVEAKRKDKKVAMFGTGAIGLIATRYTSLKESLISCIFDDNSSIWGSNRLGIEILSPSNIGDNKNISEIVISANPCYIDLIEGKIKALTKNLDITLHLPKIL